MIISKTRTEQAQLDFVGGLMEYNSLGLGKAMTDYYKARQERLSGDDDAVSDVARLMDDAPVYRFSAFFELNNHALMFRTVLDILEKRRDDVHGWLNDYNRKDAVGSLALDSTLPIPDYYRKVEIHTQPGSYHGEFAGFLYHWMIGPFLVHRDDKDEMGWQLARGAPTGNY